jgi:hypothetical protein
MFLKVNAKTDKEGMHGTRGSGEGSPSGTEALQSEDGVERLLGFLAEVGRRARDPWPEPGAVPPLPTT